MAIEQRGNKYERTQSRLRETFETLAASGEPCGVGEFAKRCGIDRSTLYKYPEILADVSEYARRTQPKTSRRGAMVAKLEAKKRQIDANLRREHGKLSRELPQLSQDLEETKAKLDEVETRCADAEAKYTRLKRGFEYLMMLALEAGASPSEIESAVKCIDPSIPGSEPRAEKNRLIKAPEGVIPICRGNDEMASHMVNGDEA